MKRGTTMNINEMNVNDIEMNVNDIMAEVNAKGFIAEATTAKENKVVKMSRTETVQKKKTAKGIEKNTAMKFVKIVAFMGAIGICGYLKLMSPVLYIPIELVSLCVGCFKAGEYKGKADSENR